MTISNHKSMARTPSQRAGNSRLSALRYRLGVMVLLLIALGNPVSAVAQCPGSMVDIFTSSVIRSATSMGAWPASVSFCFGSPTMSFYGMGTAFGAMSQPTSCQFSFVVEPTRKAYFLAAWATTAPTSENQGCQFNCPNTAAGTCLVKSGTGLPVELMEFSVEHNGTPSN